jgi:uncharacterized membrane protein YgcG
MSIGFIVFLAFAGAIVGLIVLAARSAKQSAAKSEAYFVSMFPDLQPLFHPKNVQEFVRARLAQAPARSGMSVRSPPGFAAAHEAQVAFDTDKKGRERETWRLLDAGGKELARFLFEADKKDGMVRVGQGKFRVARAANDPRVRYWHPDREFKWAGPGLWKFVTRVSEQPIDSSDRGTSFSDSSSSSSSSSGATRTAAAAAGIAAAGGAFDGGGASNTWDDSRSGSNGETSTATAGATSY